MPHEHAVCTARAVSALRQVDMNRSAGRKFVEPLLELRCRRIKPQLASIEPDAATSIPTCVQRHARKRG